MSEPDLKSLTYSVDGQITDRIKKISFIFRLPDYSITPVAYHPIPLIVIV